MSFLTHASAAPSRKTAHAMSDPPLSAPIARASRAVSHRTISPAATASSSSAR